MENYLTATKLSEIAKEVLDTVAEYKNRLSYSEKHLELVLLAILRREYDCVETQVDSKLPAKSGAKRQNQIDFMVGTTNRVMIEFAVRTKTHGNEHHASQNKPELQKLTVETVAKVRYLLILDVSAKAPMEQSVARTRFKKQTAATPFKKVRGITVVYGYLENEIAKTYSVKC